MPHAQQQVRVVLPLLAVRSDLDSSRSRFVEVRAGSVMTTVEDFDQPGLIHVRIGADDLLVFARDLSERTEAVEGHPFSVDGLIGSY
jgi:hypothetical protein